MTTIAAGLAKASALKVVDPTLFAALGPANHALATSAGCRDLHAWLGSDQEDRADSVVLHGFRSRGRRIGVMIRRDGSFDLLVSCLLGTGYMPLRTIPLAPSQASAILNCHVCEEPDAYRRSLTDRLGAALGMLSVRTSRKAYA